MKKIEKLEEFNWVSGRDAITIALCNTIIRKQNEVIDYLNTQPQAEERKSVCDKHHREICRECMHNGTWIFEDTPEEKKTLVQLRRVFDKKRVKEWDRIAMETYKQATQDTPEEKEGWEERFVKRFGYFSSEIDFIKNLLLEREREVLESMRDWVIEYYKDTWNIRDFDAEKAIGRLERKIRQV